jgi:hypothetical protein
MNSLFTLVFDDNSTFAGGTLEDTKWTHIPDKKIRSMFYLLPTGDYLSLGGYDKYYHMIECTSDLTGDNKGKLTLEYVYIMGKKNEYVNVYKINLKDGNINFKQYLKDSEFITKLNSSFWR